MNNKNNNDDDDDDDKLQQLELPMFSSTMNVGRRKKW